MTLVATRYNTLVATCIGEEGLDIGEVDLIINYDAPKSAIRQTQRSGRTGRKHEGRVVYLVTAGIEEENYERSLQKQRAMRAAMTHARSIQFCTSTHRLLPADMLVRAGHDTPPEWMPPPGWMDDAPRHLASTHGHRIAGVRHELPQNPPRAAGRRGTFSAFAHAAAARRRKAWW